MYRDPSEFRERFKAYKDGKSVREIYGLPGYYNGKFSAATKKKIDHYYGKLIANGYDPISAVGILGNAMQESGLDPDSTNSLGYSGLLLNSKAILQAIINQYGDHSEQSLFRYVSDWTDGSTWIRKGPYAKDTALYSKSYLRKGYKTPEEAAYLFLKRYERAIVVDPKTKKPLLDANGNYIYQDKDKRLKYARDIYNYVTRGQVPLVQLTIRTNKLLSEPIAVQDATRIATTIPQEKTIPIADPRNATIAEAQRAMWAHAAFENMPKISDMPIWESHSLPALEPIELDVTPFKYNNGKLPGYSNGKIRIKPANRGKFNATKKRTGKTTEELTHSKNPLTRKRAIFAQNARKWHHADGKLPVYTLGKNPTNATMYDDGTFVDDYTKVFDNLVAVGTDKRPLYQRYDASNSTYDSNAIRSFTDFAPVIGDIGLGLDAYDAFLNKDYTQAGVLGAMLLLPNALEKPARSMIRFGLKHSPNFTKGLYDIYNLYSKGADNKRLRRYAEDVQDLLGSDYISERAAKYHRTSNAVEQINNIDNTTARFSHYPNGLFGRPTINLSPLGINKQFQSPIPILLRAGGMFNPHSRQIIIKRTNNPIQMRQTTYHEASHASDLSNPSKYGINMYDTDIMRGVSDLLNMSTEKRARIISVLTDAFKSGIDINNQLALELFVTNPNYINRNLDLLWNRYTYKNGVDDFYFMLDNGR